MQILNRIFKRDVPIVQFQQSSVHGSNHCGLKTSKLGTLKIEPLKVSAFLPSTGNWSFQVLALNSKWRHLLQSIYSQWNTSAKPSWKWHLFSFSRKWCFCVDENFARKTFLEAKHLIMLQRNVPGSHQTQLHLYESLQKNVEFLSSTFSSLIEVKPSKAKASTDVMTLLPMSYKKTSV